MSGRPHGMPLRSSARARAPDSNNDSTVQRHRSVSPRDTTNTNRIHDTPVHRSNSSQINNNNDTDASDPNPDHHDNEDLPSHGSFVRVGANPTGSNTSSIPNPSPLNRIPSPPRSPRQNTPPPQNETAQDPLPARDIEAMVATIRALNTRITLQEQDSLRRQRELQTLMDRNAVLEDDLIAAREEARRARLRADSYASSITSIPAPPV